MTYDVFGVVAVEKEIFSGRRYFTSFLTNGQNL